ncbi:alpha/beta hydrolase [Skermania piniformis]|uniref:Lysophospholipase n=1 Tax=Skermania pinensis TaxID=39122 RepID=A0ABX8SDG5_9ACTN|nr:alpha/beta hydrolase [Skermania piniformis]QXQ15019.1 lysophospholipase [Skermania piniformis]
MQTREGEFAGFAGPIHWRAWLPDTPAKAVVVLVHGVAEHSGRYGHVAQTLTDAGYAVYAHDHHGHGRSAGKPANIESLDGLADDLGEMTAVARSEQPGLALFLIAHSMGALTTLYYLTRDPAPLAGVVLSAPPLEVPVVNPMLRAASGVLTRVTPNLGVLKLDSSMISRDPAVVRDYDTDPLNFRGKLPVRTGAEILRITELVGERLPRIDVPMLVLHGTADRLADISGAELVATKIGSTDFTFTRYPGLYHEVFNEPERAQVLNDTVSWLDAHSG